MFDPLLQNKMMEESMEESTRRKDMMHVYKACQEALRIISDVSIATVIAPTPAAVKNDLIRLVYLMKSCLLLKCIFRASVLRDHGLLFLRVKY